MFDKTRFEASTGLLSREFTFRRGGQCVARAARKRFAFANSHRVEVEKGEDDVTVLATAVALRLACNDKHEGL
jgi:uncharacterized protein YxjI